MWPWIPRIMLFIPKVSCLPTEAPKKKKKKKKKKLKQGKKKSHPAHRPARVHQV